jgi:alcohol dehydrogenase (cytochrome c)
LDPNTGLFYVTSRESCATYYAWRQEYKPGEQYWAGASTRSDELGDSYSALRAIDPITGERKWEFRHAGAASQAAVLTTASGVVFSGDAEGNFMAFDGTTGKNLWRHQLGAGIHGTAGVTYMLDGRQYVLVPVGTTLTAFALPAER